MSEESEVAADHEPKGLVVVATPIGNLGDLSKRAIDALTSADYWIVEDTRVSGKLAFYLGLEKRMRILNDHTRADQLDRLLEELPGHRCALLTDGGTPVISDPGTRLLDACYDRGISVSGVPGPSAPIFALSLSGFFGQRFAFLGFLGRKPGDMRKELSQFAESPYTLILFESPHRLDTLIEVAGNALGDRRYAICRELTKTFEQVWRGRLSETPSAQMLPRKGELTVVIEGLRRNQPK